MVYGHSSTRHQSHPHQYPYQKALRQIQAQLSTVKVCYMLICPQLLHLQSQRNTVTLTVCYYNVQRTQILKHFSLLITMPCIQLMKFSFSPSIRTTKYTKCWTICLKSKNSCFGNVNKVQKRSDSNALLQVLNCPDNNIISNFKNNNSAS